MSTTVLKETVGFPVTVKVVSCKAGGYAWATEGLPLVGQADTIEDIPALVSEMGADLIKFLIGKFDIQPGDR